MGRKGLRAMSMRREYFARVEPLRMGSLTCFEDRDEDGTGLLRMALLGFSRGVKTGILGRTQVVSRRRVRITVSLIIVDVNWAVWQTSKKNAGFNLWDAD